MSCKKGKRKAIPVTGRGDPQGFEMSRFPHFLDSRLTDGEVINLMCRQTTFIPRRLLTYLCKRPCKPQGYSTAGRMRLIEKSSDIGNQTRSLPACSIVIQCHVVC
jgi:hypothetical protein